MGNSKFEKFVEYASLTWSSVISGVPNENVMELKNRLNSRKELTDYTINVKNHGDYNTLILQRKERSYQNA